MPQGSGQPYQGYPYVNPSFTEAPTVDAVTAGRWTNLPRTQLTTFTRREDVVTIEEGPRDEDLTPKPPASTNNKPPQTRPESLDPVVYIDLPEINEEGTLSPVSTAREGDRNPEFVQETIFYDPFENRRIELSGGSSVQSSIREEREDLEERPAPSRPAYLGIQSPSGSAGSTPVSAIPPFMTKEPNVYRRPTPENDFNLSPIPVTEFPEPPPAYSEFDNTRPVVEQPRPAPAAVPPRTQVTVAPEAHPNSSQRKLINCPFCGIKVYTLMIRQSGTLTHFLAGISILLCLIPVCIIIYCCDCCKYKNHYCPACNSLIGYEIPMLCSKMVLVKI